MALTPVSRSSLKIGIKSPYNPTDKLLVYQQIVGTNPGRWRVVAKQGQDNQSDGCWSSNDRSRMYFPSKIK
jgi:hypothetical protein